MSVVEVKCLAGMVSTRLERNRAIREVLTPYRPANQVLLPELCALVEGYDTRPGQRFCTLPEWIPEGTVVSDDGRGWSICTKATPGIFDVRGSRTFADGACRWRFHIKEFGRGVGCWAGVADVSESPPSGFRDFSPEKIACAGLSSGLGFTRMPGVFVLNGELPNAQAPLGDLSIEFFADVGASILYVSMGDGRFYPAFTGLDLTKCTPYCCIRATDPSKPIIIESADE